MVKLSNHGVNECSGIFSIHDVLKIYRDVSSTPREKGSRFEDMIRRFMLTSPTYSNDIESIWLWDDFPYKGQISDVDMGIDLVLKSKSGDYWAIQCKFYDKKTAISKGDVDSFLSTSGRTFCEGIEGYNDESAHRVGFSHRLLISTTNRWGAGAKNVVKNQNPPVSILSLSDLANEEVDWKKLVEGKEGGDARLGKKTLRQHQEKAVDSVIRHFKDNDRAKIIMACGTGKTFTSLKIAQRQSNTNRLVLFLVPSIALLGQTLREWKAQSDRNINAICICSDPKANRLDDNPAGLEEFGYPATTDLGKLREWFKKFSEENVFGDSEISGTAEVLGNNLTVIFSTYQSIGVVSELQRGLLADGERAEFDLIVCDEAHRTTGFTLKGDDDSSFVRVHDNDFIKGLKRLYMTATPRLYSEDSKSKAKRDDVALWSMDDEGLYGAEVYRIGFGEAVKEGLLSDYKVLILTIREETIPIALQRVIADNKDIETGDMAKLIGCINALSKKVVTQSDFLNSSDPRPMRTAVAFCGSIKESEKISNMFNEHKDKYYDSLSKDILSGVVRVRAEHVDGGMGAAVRDGKLSWLKDGSDAGGYTGIDTDTSSGIGNSGDVGGNVEDIASGADIVDNIEGNVGVNECRILTNVRCLSEGVDVPSLDAVMFLSPKNSQIDVVQSVGRVMRQSEGKKYGYIIIPVVISEGVSAEHALDDNERFRVIWSVLNALRAHDDRFEALVNQLDFNKDAQSSIIIGDVGSVLSDDEYECNQGSAGEEKRSEQLKLDLTYMKDLQDAILGRIVDKVGNKKYWENWAKDVSEIAKRNIKRIDALISKDGEHRDAFIRFMEGLRVNINPHINEAEVIEMLAQHIITKPVFEALFENYSFVKSNPISRSMQGMLDVLEGQELDRDNEVLDKFYLSVKERVSGVTSYEGRQRIIIELYDKFFKTAFPKVVDRLGIVYTPVEIVDFINNSVAEVLKREFGCSISDEGVNILDPFTGTGTFITRLIQTGLINKKDLPRKFEKELKANEIVLLAYYIASINIENAFYDVMNPHKGANNVVRDDADNGIRYDTKYGARDNTVGSATKYGADGTGVRSMNKGISKDINTDTTSFKGVDDGADKSIVENIRGVQSFVDGVSNVISNGAGGAKYSDINYVGDIGDDVAGAGTGTKMGIDIATFADNDFEDSDLMLDEVLSELSNKVSNKVSNEVLDEVSDDVLDEGSQGFGYQPFQGICLTDTFQLYEADNSKALVSEVFKQNSERARLQKAAPITVIIGNPPYSVGQKSGNDNAKNEVYPRLHQSIASTYAKGCTTSNKNSLYDSYVKAFRLASDILSGNIYDAGINENNATNDSNSTNLGGLSGVGQGGGGVVGFITNSGWVDNNSMDGFRKSLAGEFSSIYVFNLRGAIRGKSGEAAKKEGQNVFDIMAGVAVVVLVKNNLKTAVENKIYYYDIGDYLSRAEKIAKIKSLKSIMSKKIKWQILTPNEHGDWLNQRSNLFAKFIPLAPEKKFAAESKSIFTTYSVGLKTNRDAWIYNFSKAELTTNLTNVVEFYNRQVELYRQGRVVNPNIKVEEVIDYNPTKISWSDTLKDNLKRNNKLSFNSEKLVYVNYRPFCKVNGYFCSYLNERRYQQPKLFPKVDSYNLLICVSGVGSSKGLEILIVDAIPDLNILYGGAQCFPLYWYEENSSRATGTLFGSIYDEEYTTQDGVSDYILWEAQAKYRDNKITKEDIFYYVYGLLHSKDYRERFVADLKKVLPRIVLVDNCEEFYDFSTSGRQLAELHLKYEQSDLCTEVKVIGAESGDFIVDKMKFAKGGDKSIIEYNSKIRIENIPQSAYDYTINGKSAIEWIMDRYKVSVNKDSGIKNDPNNWAKEFENDRYILDLLLKIINISVKTNNIVDNLPKIDFDSFEDRLF